MTKLRNLARNQDCLVRLPNICNGNPETVVLAHYRLSGMCGMGLKPHDLFASFACSDCHSEIDRRTRKLELDFVRLAHLEGVIRTQEKFLLMGVLVIK